MTRARFHPQLFDLLGERLGLWLGCDGLIDDDELTGRCLGGERMAEAQLAEFLRQVVADGCGASGPCRYHPCGRSARCGHRGGRRRCPSGGRSSWSNRRSRTGFSPCACQPAPLLRCQRTTTVQDVGTRLQAKERLIQIHGPGFAAVQFDHVEFHYSSSRPRPLRGLLRPAVPQPEHRPASSQCRGQRGFFKGRAF